MAKNPQMKSRSRTSFKRWVFYLRNKYSPYIYTSWRGLIASLAIIVLTALLLSIGKVPEDGVLKVYRWNFSFSEYFFLLFFLSCGINLLKEVCSQGVLFPNGAERAAITNRKRLTASAINDSIGFVGSYKAVSESNILEHRKKILDLMKSNLESYFHIKESDPKRRLAIALIELYDDPCERYRIVARDSRSMNEERGCYDISPDHHHLYKPIEAIRSKGIVFTDNLDSDYGELGEKSYNSVMAFPIFWTTKGEDGLPKTYCFGAISVDFTECYRFNGAQEEIETNLRPYYTLLIFSFAEKINALLHPRKEGEHVTAIGT